MQPTPPASDPTATPHAGDAVVEFVRTSRPTAGFLLLGLGVVFLALCAWTVYKAARPAVPESEQKKADDPLTLDPSPVKVKDPGRNDYIVGAVLAVGGFLIAAAGSVWLLVNIPPPDEARQRADARALILAVGGLLGALFIVAGVWYFYRWSASLDDWLEKGKVKEARFVLFPILMIVFGAGLMFLSTQPARAEERNNATMRRLVYGANMGLSVLLLFVALVVLNLFIGPRLPNKLDTTEEGFYSLSDGTKEFLGRLNQPATAYAIMPDAGSRTEDDIRRLLQSVADAGGGKFQVRTVSPVTDKSKFRELVGKYPVLEVNDYGVLLTVGEDEKRHSFIPVGEFVRSDQPAARGAESSRSFVGESRLMRELLFLKENEQKAVVYFTQQAGELSLQPPGDDSSPAASASRLKAYLERNYLEVKPLVFDSAAPKVPDDAAVVVVAEPRSPLSDRHVAAIRTVHDRTAGHEEGQVDRPRQRPLRPEGPRPIQTGLEGLLLEFNVRLGDQIIVGEPSRELAPEQLEAGFTVASVRARHPVAMALGAKASFSMPGWRPVTPVQQGGPAYRSLALLVTQPGRPTWLEEERPRNWQRIYNGLNTNPAVPHRQAIHRRPAAGRGGGFRGRVRPARRCSATP